MIPLIAHPYTNTHTHKIFSVTNIDISCVVIDQMTEKYKTWMSSLRWYTMNACKLQFDDGIFDVCLDKATFDSILCSSGSSEDRRFRIHSMLLEISRCMKKNSVYIMVSCPSRASIDITRTQGIRLDSQKSRRYIPTKH